MNGQMLTYKYNGILFINKNNIIIDTNKTMGEPQNTYIVK